MSGREGECVGVGHEKIPIEKERNNPDRDGDAGPDRDGDTHSERDGIPEHQKLKTQAARATGDEKT